MEKNCVTRMEKLIRHLLWLSYIFLKDIVIASNYNLIDSSKWIKLLRKKTRWKKSKAFIMLMINNNILVEDRWIYTCYSKYPTSFRGWQSFRMFQKSLSHLNTHSLDVLSQITRYLKVNTALQVLRLQRSIASRYMSVNKFIEVAFSNYIPCCCD